MGQVFGVLNDEIFYDYSSCSSDDDASSVASSSSGSTVGSSLSQSDLSEAESTELSAVEENDELYTSFSGIDERERSTSLA
ncbi:hypothetical protein PRIPAC_70248 [Pristionchus pacificus]|uniref:Uncharacterized protein n=1 Tax=Pristionchus pacificus TaxID=54126 RepID=A0A2A6C513_PRIPA|nr:hypothetical protein PRIPAC_70248 [Pristionchus pacificus]|eukprot:PDM73265.1 hypothetical protein PRIPAC_40621 [Pristionchus pacificus]